MNDLLTRRAPLAASSWNAEERTFEVIFSTGASVERMDARGAYGERLDLNQDWSSFIGAPVLNAHKRGDVTDVLGHVIKAWTVSPSEARAIIKLSRRPDVETVVQDVLDGHLRGVSVGYAVADWRESTEGGKRTKTATRWAPAELSIVPVAADPGATIRSEATMPEPTTTTQQTSTVPTVTRAAVNAEIRSIGALAGLDQAWIDGQIDSDATADTARAAAFQAMQARGPAPIHTARASVGTDHNDPTAIRSAMADAIAHRLVPGRCKLEGRATEFRGYRILDMVGDLAHARGDRVNLRDQNALIERAVGAHSTGDFPLLLADAANKSLLANYQAAEPTYRAWAARRSFNDFKPHSFLRVGDFPQFKEIGESGEVKYGTISENREQVRAKEYNAGLIIGRRALINDDLSALADFSSMIAIRAAADENRMVYALLTGAPVMSDGKALFHADHGNLTPPDAVAGQPTLQASVSSLRKQKSLDGLALNLTPRFLIVGPDLELGARQVLTAITPSKTADVNPWAGSMELIVDANITGFAWYIAADPAAGPSIVYGYVAGAEGPQIRTEIDFDTRAVKVAAGLDFGCGAIDFRGLVKNPGE
ncbi:prohead protease/major capsid protein fusion protein [Ancylobacter sp. SL191]|uniref:prohead protease/major capsid protein fusion protein n=1 Tax=Ancylobacter sp. SL191 TaxID=2995166 RepID=UPI00226ECD37|nr:prohead protease/major capsid protein fusion protein [Ancylobacter sp. SL191]WAC26269.1 Mu-like prophage major head subunit gpT family protein [Ancylobacter sp. SL191]